MEMAFLIIHITFAALAHHACTSKIIKVCANCLKYRFLHMNEVVFETYRIQLIHLWLIFIAFFFFLPNSNSKYVGKIL